MSRFHISCLLASLIGSRFAHAAPAGPIFEIVGNERTRFDYISELANNCLRDSSGSEVKLGEQLPYLVQCLKNSKLFSEVKASLDTSGQNLRIEVVEKWTLIPAPFFSKSGATSKAGLVVFDSNVLGQGLTLGMGATISNLGHSYFTVFSNPYLFGSRFFSTIVAREEKSIFELKMHREIVDSVLEGNLGGTLSLGYHFTWFNVSGQFSRTDRSYYAHEGNKVPSSSIRNILGLNWDYDKRDYRLYFSEGWFLRSNFAANLGPSEGEKRLTTSAYTVSWQHMAFADHSILLQTSGLKIIGGRLTDAERVGSSKGFRGIETKTAWAESYQSGTIEYQIPITSFEKGTLTWSLFADGGHIQNRGGGDKDVSYTASGAGFYFYLKQLAVPGIGIELGNNRAYQGNFVNVAVGLPL